MDMKQLYRVVSVIFTMGMLSACGGNASPIPETLKKVPAVASETVASSTATNLADATWITTPLTNVSTGETFRMIDYKGKVVLVEMMAVWCTNCLQQQGQVKQMHQAALGQNNDKVISLSMDVDPNEQAKQLKEYRQQQGFEWSYTVAPASVAREISNLYGSQFLNPSAVPMLIIDKQGGIHPLPFGVKSVASLQEALKPYLQ